MSALSLVAAVVAFALFALSTDAHALTRLRSRPDAKTRQMRRLAAWSLLALSFALAVTGRGWIFGPVVWTALLMLAAGIVFLVLNLLPPTLRIKE